MIKTQTMGNRFIKLAAVGFALGIINLVGCGDASIAPVSGKVTWDGEPVAGIRLVFSPILHKGQTDAGPWSSGLNNEAGEYSLETRHKDVGAVVGEHTVSFVYDDVTHIDTYKELLREAKQAKDQAAIDAAKKEIAQYNEAQKTRPKASGNHTEKFEVPSAGTTEANFELPE